jgi:Asp-tRNA(Asn)/Glu-tRNA(Gln) amidotransferase A subunit family amidase
MIRPATYNGIYGLKPTWGSISKEGIKVIAPTLDTIGLFARSLADIELVASIYRIVDPSAPIPPKPLSACRFRFVKTQAWDLAPNSAELESAWTRSQEILRKAGAEVVEEELGTEFDGLMGKGSASRLVNVDEARTNLLYEVSSRDRIDSIRWDTKEIVERKTEPVSKRQVTDAYDRLATLRPRIDEIAGKYDAILTPSAPSQATQGLENTGDSRFCAMWTALHVPVVNIPGFASEDGLPIGLSLVAPR